MKGCEGDRGTPNSHLTRPRCDSRRDTAVTAARLPLGICPFGHHRHAGVTPGRTPARGETHVSYSRRGRCPSSRLRSPARASSHAFPGKRGFQAISLSSRTPVHRPLGCGVPWVYHPSPSQAMDSAGAPVARALPPLSPDIVPHACFATGPASRSARQSPVFAHIRLKVSVALPISRASPRPG